MLGKNIYLLAIQNRDYHKDLSSRIKFHGLSLQNGIPWGGGGRKQYSKQFIDGTTKSQVGIHVFNVLISWKKQKLKSMLTKL